MRAALAVALLGLIGCGGGPNSSVVSDRLPTHTAPIALRAGLASLADTVAGRVAVIDVWAAWCTPCRAAVPALRAWSRELGPRGAVLVGVNLGEPPDQAADAARTLGMDYPVYGDPNFEFGDRVGASTLPTLLVVDRDGRIVYRSNGLDDALRARVDALLQGAPGP